MDGGRAVPPGHGGGLCPVVLTMGLMIFMAPLIWSLVHFCLLLFNLTVWLWPCLWPEEGRGMGIDVAPGKLLFSTAAGVFFLLLLLVAAASSVGLAAAEFVALVVLLMWRCLEFKKSWGELSNMRKGLLSTGPYAACSACPSNILMFCVSFFEPDIVGRGGWRRPFRLWRALIAILMFCVSRIL